MKKIIFTLLLTLILSTGTSYAQIKEMKDSFTGDVSYFSINVDVRDLNKSVNQYVTQNTVSLIKSYEKTQKEITYILALSLLTRQWEFFYERDVDIKIDDKMYSAKFFSTESELKGTHTETSHYAYMTESRDSELINALKNANKVTCRHYSKKSNITWDVPDNVLKEWKEIINKQVGPTTK